MSRSIVASAPTRIDFAGGTLDIPPLYLFHEPAVTVNVAIDLCATVAVRETKERGIHLVARDRDMQAFWPSADQIDWRQNRFLELTARLLRSFVPLSAVGVTTDCQGPAGGGGGTGGRRGAGRRRNSGVGPPREPPDVEERTHRICAGR